MKEKIPDPQKIRRAAYLRETGRLEQLKAEQLEHVDYEPDETTQARKPK